MRLSQEMDDEIENRLDPANKRTKTRPAAYQNKLTDKLHGKDEIQR